MVNGKISLAWGDGDHDFNIAKIGQIFELQDKCGCGLMEIFNRLREGRWRFEDIRETLRLGLIGGGKSPAEALVLTKRYVDERPFAENTQAAMTILMAAIVGPPGEEQPEKKAGADRDEKSSIQKGELSDPPSMPSAPASAGGPGKPGTQHSSSSHPASTASTPPTEPKNNPRRRPSKSSTSSSRATHQS